MARARSLEKKRHPNEDDPRLPLHHRDIPDRRYRLIYRRFVLTNPGARGSSTGWFHDQEIPDIPWIDRIECVECVHEYRNSREETGWLGIPRILLHCVA